LIDENPDLVIHCGVSGSAKEVCIEQCAYNTTYEKQDILDKIPANKCCRSDGIECLETKLDVNQICSLTNDYCKLKLLKPTCVSSRDPGRYLCCFIYYISLCKDNSKALFVHVPPSSVFSVNEMSQALQQIIYCALKQI
jgi:pyrrolidone-carboxylate peptidase